METIILASGNENKLKEIRELLKDLDYKIISKDDAGLGDVETIEDGDSLADNSLKKARDLWKEKNAIIIADDSGLFVRALNWEPGIHSARYAQENGNGEANNKKLLFELADKDDRYAEFRAVISLKLKTGEELCFEGICPGEIGFENKGLNGFGYDPLFYPEGYNNSFGELSSTVKNSISHRAKALKKLRESLQNIKG